MRLLTEGEQAILLAQSMRLATAARRSLRASAGEDEEKALDEAVSSFDTFIARLRTHADPVD